MRPSAVQAMVAMSVAGARALAPAYSTSEAGNPFVDGWYADPDAAIYDGQYWIYPTSSLEYGQQTYLDAFSSPDLVHWTKHANVLTTADFKWAKRAVWAPAPVRRNGRYYLYFSANDIKENDGDAVVGGIGVGVADRPEGPYLDAIGAPLIGAYHNGAQPIDQDVFVDDDGQAYIYYGGHSHCNVARLNDDMVSVGNFSDGGQFRDITPANYVEGAQMFKRKGRYYMMWSEGGWTGPDYAVSYAVAASPLGPFERVARILQQDAAVATGSGHNGVINVPGTDVWYIVYHRRPLGDANGNHRQLCYDRMYFNDDGTIRPIVMQVSDNFDDGDMVGWATYGGDWAVKMGQLGVGGPSLGGKALLNANFSDFHLDADVAVTSTGTGDAGLVFRATSPATGTDAYDGYYAAISAQAGGRVVMGRADVLLGNKEWDGMWTQLADAAVRVEVGAEYHVRVSAVGGTIKVFVGDMDLPRITANDSMYLSGTVGVRVYNATATFDNVSVAKA